MFIESINIKKFRVLEEITINFRTPDNKESTLDNGNIVNIIAGVNGSGKTSLLEAIFLALANPADFFYENDYGSISLSKFNNIDLNNWIDLRNKIEQLNKKNRGEFNVHNDPRIIFLPSQQNFNYSSVSQLSPNYIFSNRINTSQIIGQAEFYIKEFILSKERESNIADPKQRTQAAIDAFNSNFLDAKLLTKLVDLSKQMFNRPIFKNASNDEVTIDQLSDGEKQLYGRLIALMILEPSNSIILIDEPEIALHPAWQQRIMQLYSHIGKNNQFIVATHSPQIIASIPYKNRILLRKENNKIEPTHCHSPPSGLDINSILYEIMGANPRSPALDALYQQYRQFVEKGEENTLQAQAVKEKLSEESEHSEFMQEMHFLIELRDA
jgi:predicted ATP-dependent endonuclease of OLD family